MVISAPAEVVWDTVSKFGKQALWTYADHHSTILCASTSLDALLTPTTTLAF